MKSKKKRLEKELVSTLQINFEGVFNCTRQFFFSPFVLLVHQPRETLLWVAVVKKRFSKFCTNFQQHLHSFTAITAI